MELFLHEDRVDKSGVAPKFNVIKPNRHYGYEEQMYMLKIHELNPAGMP